MKISKLNFKYFNILKSQRVTVNLISNYALSFNFNRLIRSFSTFSLKTINENF